MTPLPATQILQLERKGAHLFVTMNDPTTRNALTTGMLAELEAVLDATQDDRSVRALVLQGRDGMFCAGGNLKGALGEAVLAAGVPDPVHEENQCAGRLFHNLNRHPMAVIAVVDGPAMGGGLGLACCADIVVTTPRARFAVSETSLGLTPAQIAPFIVNRIGLATARRLALTGARFDGPTAAAIGLSDHHCGSAEHALATVRRLLADIGRCGRNANAVTKALLFEVAAIDRTDLIRRAADAFTACLRSDEGREGIAAFIEKRPPSWSDAT
ncbi:MAG: enoyl-CoA hydratase [Gammaproteobacteria bacterium]|jgi:isohexenylglutaconyl-CoA hydratase|nr:enoyl-CoA hydratase [Gammaproteobacteria bacterium]